MPNALPTSRNIIIIELAIGMMTVSKPRWGRHLESTSSYIGQNKLAIRLLCDIFDHKRHSYSIANEMVIGNGSKIRKKKIKHFSIDSIVFIYLVCFVLLWLCVCFVCRLFQIGCCVMQCETNLVFFWLEGWSLLLYCH